MAIEIIELCPPREVLKTAKCPCGAKLQYAKKDVKVQNWTDYGGFRNSYKYIKCPNCKKKVVLST